MLANGMMWRIILPLGFIFVVLYAEARGSAAWLKVVLYVLLSMLIAIAIGSAC